MLGTVVTQWHWDRFLVDRVALGHFCVGPSGNGTFLCWTEWYWDIFVLDRVALGHFCVGPSGTGTFVLD